MKRLCAFIIDYTIALLILGGVRIILFGNSRNYNFLWLIAFLTLYFCYWMNDVCFKGSSVGKKIVKLDMAFKEGNVVLLATLHSVLKMICCFLWPLTLMVYFVLKCKMPYDDYFYKE